MSRLIKYILIILSISLILSAISSLYWRFEHDAPIMLYLSFLVDRFDYIPYRDFFDMNLPGTYIAYYLIGHFADYSDIGVRIVDLIILAIILFINWQLMKQFGWKVAWFGTVLWGLLYLKLGPQTSLQREYLILLPVITAVFISTTLRQYSTILRFSAIGFLFGIAATIKPHAVIGLPLLWLYHGIEVKQAEMNISPEPRSFLSGIILPTSIGFFIPVSIAVFYLWATGAIGPFLDIAMNYWSLYTHLTGDHKTISGLHRISYLVSKYRALGGFGLWLVPATLGAYISLYHSKLTPLLKRQVVLLLGLAFCYSIYTVLAGQFWNYHWLLFQYFMVQIGSLCVVQQSGNSTRRAQLFPIIVLLLVILLAMNPLQGFSSQILKTKLPPPKNGLVDEIASYLQANLRTGDSVQPLDWTGGAVHAMLISRAKIATPFVYDFHFYHHISNPYIQSLRRKFLMDLQAAKPRYIVQVVGEAKPWVSGEDTTREFPELLALLNRQYTVVSSGDGYFIWELSNSLY